MSSSAAPRCRHIKVNGTQCGSPAQRNECFCYFHQHCRPITLDFRSGYRDYSSSEVILPAFEDAHSIQLALRQVTELILRRKIDDKTAGLVLYSLQIASSNLKRMELEKPQPEQVVIDLEMESETPMAAPIEAETARESSAPAQHEGNARPANAQPKSAKTKTKRMTAATKTFPPGRSRPVIGPMIGFARCIVKMSRKARDLGTRRAILREHGEQASHRSNRRGRVRRMDRS
jgi:hypothetical protein